jgi:hypothetical protein
MGMVRVAGQPRRAAGGVALPRAVLAPRLAACYKITMGYILVTML